MHKRVRTKQKCVRACQCACQNVRTQIYASCAHIFSRNFTKIVLIVHYYVMTLSSKFHKDPSFCWGDRLKRMLNMHARVMYACSKFWYTCVHTFALCAHVCAQISTKKNFGKDLCPYARTRRKNVHACVSKVRICIYASCVHVQHYFAHISTTEAKIFMKF